jgi:hypothetical protein
LISPLIGLPGERLTGIESRTLREALHLERRHVAGLTTALGLWDRGEASTEDVTGWERSKGHGYPLAVSEVLQQLNAGVEDLVDHLYERTYRGKGEVATVIRPRGDAHWSFPGLRDSVEGLSEAEADKQLRAYGEDFWHSIVGAAITRLALALQAEGAVVRIELERNGGGS